MDHDAPATRLSRRRLLRGAFVGAVAAVGAPLAACGRLLAPDEEPPGVLIAEATPAPPPPTPTPEPEPTPLPPPVVNVEPREVGQGETALIIVRQPGARGGHARFLNQRVPLIPDGDLLWAPVGVGLFATLGETEATLTTYDARGQVAAEVTAPLRVVHVERPVDYLVASPAVTAVLTVEAQETEVALRTWDQFNRFESRPRWTGTIRQPCDGFLTTAFGQGRSLNGGPVTGQHSGTDIANALGTPISSAADGRVAWAGWMPIRGNSVLVDHGAGVVTGYHHLEEIRTATGESVLAGQVVGLMGSTGFSTGPHLHWEMTIYGINVDPMTWTERAFLPAAAAT
jgi:murein DD-endopeptidase MepM/ murein hydrolase activator NlpD